MTEYIETEYSKLFDSALVNLADKLGDHLAELVEDLPRIDRVSVRAKAPKSFVKKAMKTDCEGNLKYQHPFSQIQDQIGCRITVFYLRDVQTVENTIRQYLHPIEIKSKAPEKEWEFGYFGRHFIFAIPEVLWTEVDKPENAPSFFELQIKTLFQHAWSEADHDLGYKTDKSLPSEMNRRLAYTSAQAWGADQMFDQLYSEVCAKKNDQ